MSRPDLPDRRPLPTERAATRRTGNRRAAPATQRPLPRSGKASPATAPRNRRELSRQQMEQSAAPVEPQRPIAVRVSCPEHGSVSVTREDAGPGRRRPLHVVEAVRLVQEALHEAIDGCTAGCTASWAYAPRAGAFRLDELRWQRAA